MLICPVCNNQVENDATFCPFCGVQFITQENQDGTSFDAQATTVLTPEMQNMYFGKEESKPQSAQMDEAQYFQPAEKPQQPPVNTMNTMNTANQIPSQMPVAQLKTNRSFIKMILLGLVTLFIYPIVEFCRMIGDVNTVCTRYDGKRTMNYLLMAILTPFTFCILYFVWNHNVCTRIGNELKRRGVTYNFSSTDFWLWGVLGSFIGIGPIIYNHKLITAVNKLNANFNQFG